MRLTALEMGYICGEPAHIGGGLSIIDILAVLYGKILIAPGVQDRFILSKGHGVLGLYSVLFHSGYLTKAQIDTFQTNGTNLIAHPIMNTENGIESSNGSLGQGLSMGVGMALSYQRRQKPGRIFVLLGDGECYEGSVWEAALSGAELELSNLIAVIDCNGHRNDGPVSCQMNEKAMASKWSGFGWHVIECDGHDLEALSQNLNQFKVGQPTAIIAKTIKGKGVGFMENNNDWHHNRITQKIYEEALKDLVT